MWLIRHPLFFFVFWEICFIDNFFIINGFVTRFVVGEVLFPML